MWNCLGWDNVTTYAEEVEKPERSYFISILLAFALVMVIYFGVIAPRNYRALVIKLLPMKACRLWGYC
jgi:hypothetical protein